MKVNQTILGAVNQQWHFKFRNKEMNALQKSFLEFRSGKFRSITLRNAKPENAVNGNYSSRGIGITRLLREFLATITEDNKNAKNTFSDNGKLAIKETCNYWVSNLSEIDKSNKRIEIIAFLNVKHQSIGKSTPFHHLFVEALFENKHTSISFQDIKIIIRRWLHRALLLIRLPYLFILFIIGILTLVSLFIGLANDVGYNTNLMIILSWIRSNIFYFILACIIFSVITIIDVQNNSKSSIRTNWNKYPSPKDIVHKTLATDDPKKIAQLVDKHLSQKKDYLFIIDDVNALSKLSFDVIDAIINEIVKNQKNVMIIWGYDQKKPTLQELENKTSQVETNLIMKENQIIEVFPLSSEEILEIMKTRYGHYSNRPKNFLNAMMDESWTYKIVRDEDEPLSLAGRADLIFGFLEYLEEEKKIRPNKVNFDFTYKIDDWEIDEIDFAEEFSLYLSKDQLVAERIIRQIEELDKDGNNCFRIIKYLLAFPNAEAQKEKLSTITGLEKHLFNKYVAKIINRTGLLVEVESMLKFTNPDEKKILRGLSTVTWNRDKKYSDKVFHFLLHDKDPLLQSQLASLALDCNPCIETLDILIKKGNSLAHDFGYLYLALDFITSSNGALDQWIYLLNSAQSKGKSLLHLLEWQYTTVTEYTPNEQTKDKNNLFVRPVDICKEAISYYWIIGELDSAIDLINNKWPTIKKILSDLSNTSFSEELKALDDEMNFYLAEIYFQQGKWDKTLEICIEMNSSNKSSPFTDCFLNLQASIHLHRLKGVNITKNKFSIFLENKSKENQDKITKYHKLTLKPITPNKYSNMHALRLSNRQFFLGHSDPQQRKEIIKALTKTISIIPQNSRSLLTDGDILVGSAILCKEAIFNANEVLKIITEIGEEEIDTNSKKIENAFMKICGGIEDILFFLKAFYKHDLYFERCVSLYKQIKSTTLSNENESFSTKSEELKPSFKNLTMNTRTFLVELKEDLENHYQECINNAFTVFNKLEYAIGLAELYYFSALGLDSNLIKREDRKDWEFFDPEIDRFKKSLFLREKFQIKFRCPEICMHLGMFLQIEFRNYWMQGKYFLMCGDYCSSLSYPIDQSAELYDRASSIYFTSKTKHNNRKITIDLAKKTLGLYIILKQNPDYLYCKERINEKIVSMKLLLTDLYRLEEIFDQVIKLCKELINDSKTHSNKESVLAHTYRNLGMVNFARNNITNAFKLLEKSFMLLKTSENKKENSTEELSCESKIQSSEKLEKINEITKKIDLQRIKLNILETLRLLVTYSLDYKNRTIFEKYFSELKIYDEYFEKTPIILPSQETIILHGNSLVLLGDIHLKGFTIEKHCVNEYLEYPDFNAASKYYEQSMNIFTKLGEYYRALYVVQQLFLMWKEVKYDGTKFKQILVAILKILDIDPNNDESIKAFEYIYYIFNHVSNPKSSVKYDPEKRQNLEIALSYINTNEFSKAISFLENGRRICLLEENREIQTIGFYIPSIDNIQIYKKLFEVYEHLNMLNEKQSIAQELKRIQTLRISANLLKLGEYYEVEKMYELAIRMYYLSGIQKPDNYFSQHARQFKESLCEKIENNTLYTKRFFSKDL